MSDNNGLTQKVIGIIAGLASAAILGAFGFAWHANSNLATIDVRLSDAEEVLDAVADTFDILHPRTTAAAGGGSKAAGIKDRLIRIQKREPEPAPEPAPGDDDDSAAETSPPSVTPAPPPATVTP